jgi:hypothetical protein
VRPFQRRGDVAVAVLDDDERTVIARVVADVGLLLDAEPFGMERAVPDTSAPNDVLAYLASLENHLAEPDDPALLRLLPNAAPTDREVADEFRRLTESDLRSLKTSRLRRVWEDLSRDDPEWTVPLDHALGVAAALTDLRLVIASRLGLVTDEDADLLRDELEIASGALDNGAPEGLEVDRERVWLGMLYQALTWLQDSLIACVVDQKGGDDE